MVGLPLADEGAFARVRVPGAVAVRLSGADDLADRRQSLAVPA